MEKSFEAGILDHKANQKSKIYGAFKKGDMRVAVPITKSEFDEQYPADKFEYYSLEALDKFRKDIEKAEDISDKEGAFKKATQELTPHIVHNEGTKVILYTREKPKQA